MALNRASLTKFLRSEFWLRWRALAACAGALLLVLAGYNLLTGILPTSDDVDLYFKYVRRTLEGEVPYRDFVIEYPPFSLFFFMLPALVSYLSGGLDWGWYEWLFHTQCIALLVASLWLAYRLLLQLYPGVARRSLHLLGWRLAAGTAGATAISLYLVQRFDMGAAFFTLLAIYLFYRARPGWAGVFLGLGTVTKLYPVILLPLFLLYLWYARHEIKGAVRCVLGFGGACVAVLGPVVLFGASGLRAFLSYHSDRGLEVESIFAGIVVFGSYLGLTNAISMVEYGSLNVTSYWVKPLATASTLLTVAGLLFIYYLAWRSLRRNTPLRADWLIQISSLSILWFILANKVISPQYVIWLLVFVPFWRGWDKIWLFLLALPLSFIPFPFLIDWLARLDALPFVILAVRNALLVWLMIKLARQVFWPGRLAVRRPKLRPRLAQRLS